MLAKAKEGGDGGVAEDEEAGQEGRGDQVLERMLKVEVSVRASDGEASPPQIMREPWGSCGDKPLLTRLGSLAMPDVICAV